VAEKLTAKLKKKTC